MNKIYIQGAYQTKFGELWSLGLEDLLFEAIEKGLKDAHLKAVEVEAVYLANKMAGLLSGQNHLGALVNTYFKRSLPVVRVESACASGGVATAQACQALRAGDYETVLVVGVEKMTDLLVSETSAGLMSAASSDERAAGLSFVGLYALMAQSYLNEFGATELDLTLPAEKNHFHASLNLKAQFPFPVSRERILASSLVASPLRLLECSPLTDGAAAVVLTTRPRLNGRSLVRVVASQQSGSALGLVDRESLVSLPGAVKAAHDAYNEAGLGPDDLSLVEVHDCFSISELLALEDLGFYQTGEAYFGLRKNEGWLGKERVVNASGGLKACGHPVGATGVRQLVELAVQLWGEAGKRQVEKAGVGLAHNVGGTGGTVVVHILQKED
ncbi:thiolase domain-containing protein [Patescibacteria group bacterium]|nr:thiolase domain-containing protein [Patescibacteria group bacterium]